MWSGLILAGGGSRRMGTDKSLIRLGDTTLLQRAVELVRAAGGAPLVVGGRRPDHEVAGAPQIDEAQESGRPAAGPLPALRWGLARCGSPRAVALACDLPFLTVAFVRFLVAETGQFDAVVPRIAGRWHVLAAAYTTRCLSAMDRHLAEGGSSVHGFLERVRLRVLEEREIAPFGGRRILTNVNTPDDLRRAAAALGEVER